MLVLLAISTFFLGPDSWFTFWGVKLSLFDLATIVIVPFSAIDLLISTTKLFFVLKKMDSESPASEKQYPPKNPQESCLVTTK